MGRASRPSLFSSHWVGFLAAAYKKAIPFLQGLATCLPEPG